MILGKEGHWIKSETQELRRVLKEGKDQKTNSFFPKESERATKRSNKGLLRRRRNFSLELARKSREGARARFPRKITSIYYSQR